MQPFCFEFGDRYFEFGPWQMAFRVYTESNVYTPDPAAIAVTTQGRQTILRADSFAWAGLQKRTPGQFWPRQRTRET